LETSVIRRRRRTGRAWGSHDLFGIQHLRERDGAYSIRQQIALKNVDHRNKSGGRLCNGVRP